METLLGNSAEEVAQAVIKAAKSGDTAAARLVLERVLPARKDNPVEVVLPSIDDAAGIVGAGKAILAAVAIGDLTPAEGDALMALVERQRRLIETAEMEERITALEAKGAE